MREHLIQRYHHLAHDRVEDAVAAAHHRFGDYRIRDFVPLLVERAATHALDQLHRPPTRRCPRHRSHAVPNAGACAPDGLRWSSSRCRRPGVRAWCELDHHRERPLCRAKVCDIRFLGRCCGSNSLRH
ncbi:three-helix bundle dimerization domain-containing protein [Rhodococcus pseudokoreensis]|uniref:three-helix bundle dimerization domain-containing protein n=1 Tax=Rhodococcus pseudokoreensis TaxID=2811421 RepID=UPI003B84B24B